MSESISLQKTNPLLPAEDYVFLRKQGFKHIEKLGSAIWTEYNNSDPGITILEAVCYAITDLAYRTGFEIKDLLTPENVTSETWKQIFYTARQILHNSPLTITDYRKLIIDIKGVRNAWIEPSKDYEVPFWINYNFYKSTKGKGCSGEDQLNCFGQIGLDPISAQQAQEAATKRNTEITAEIADITSKQTVIDAEITKIKNLITQEENGEKDPLKLQALRDELNKQQRKRDRLSKKVTLLNDEAAVITNATYIPSKIIEIEGLYNVIVEYEEDVLELSTREEVRQQVVERLANHRNLSEDFLSINAAEYTDFGIGASIVLEEYADPDTVLAQVFFTIYKYFTPSIRFYTIAQLLEKGYLVDEIFEGPALKHGFVDSSELEATDLFRDIRLSDIISEISDIKGVIAINYLHLPFEGFEEAEEGYFNAWIDFLRTERKVARIQPTLSQVMFCKEHDFITYNVGRPNDRKPDRMLKMFRDLKAQERKYKLEGTANDFPVPVGDFMDLEDYYPITDSLPMTYGVSDRAGIPADADEKRKAQAFQLKGYLLFFEQLLSGYLVQLNHLKDLFSFDDATEHTYFIRPLTELKDLKALLIDHANHGEEHFDKILHDFSEVIENLIETPKAFHQRRNRFLDHLLARFSEDLSEYEAISRWLTPYKVEEKLIRDKAHILKDGEYYKISSNRGKGYNYTSPDYWDTGNVSGTERRIGRLLGFESIERRTLTPTIILTEPLIELDAKKVPIQKKNKKGEPLNIVKLVNPENVEEVLLTSVEVKEGCCTDLLISDILEHADERHFYVFQDEINQRSRKTAGLAGKFWFELYDGSDFENAVLLATSQEFDKRDSREKAFKTLQKALSDINKNEGLHLVEHVLLRPKLDEVLDEANDEIDVKFLDVCLDPCDLGLGVGEGETPPYRKKVKRIPAEKCYDKLPWILEYFRYNKEVTQYDLSILFQETFQDGSESVPLKFKRYELLAQRIKDLHEYGSERINYSIVANEEEELEKKKYSFIIYGKNNAVLAQSPFVFNKKTKKDIEENKTIPFDIEEEIEQLLRYFGYELNLYCEENPCDHNEDPYSFRTTIVIPCWPKRFRDATYRNLVEKTIQTESPSHVHTKVVWVGISEMQRFEKAYSEWLQEMARTEVPNYEKVNPLIEVLNTLKTCGTCEDECDHKESESPTARRIDQ